MERYYTEDQEAMFQASVVTNSKNLPNTEYIRVLKMCRILNTEYILFFEKYEYRTVLFRPNFLNSLNTTYLVPNI